MANAAPPNPMGYPPKTQEFTRNQALAGLGYYLYRKTGDPIINFRNLQHVAKYVVWSQPYRWRTPLFRIAPRPGSALATAQLERALANRDTAGPSTRRTRRSSFGGLGYTATARERPRNARRRYVWEAYNNEDTSAKFDRLDIAFVKQLGWDGTSVTTLWHYDNPAGGSGNLVCQSPINTAAARRRFQNAKWKTEDLARAGHIVHLADLERLLGPSVGPFRYRQDAFDLEDDDRLHWLRYIRHGDLGKWIIRVSQRGETFPRSVLWQIFGCLAHACVAMTFPPLGVTYERRNTTGDDIPEVIPAFPLLIKPYRLNVVHLSLCPWNVYIENYDNNAHQDVPRMQIGAFERSAYPEEFGLSTFMPPNNFDRLNLLWTKRAAGRTGWLLPEHFSAEWDHVNYEPYSEGITDMITGEGAAGAFTEKSNIFHIGMVIWSCMLLQRTERPPRATPVPRSGPNMGDEGWTYTGEMRFQNYHTQFGRDLCDLVSDCCKHMPADRPDLEELVATITVGQDENPISNDDRRWVQRTLHEVPLPPNPIPGTREPGDGTGDGTELFP